MKKIWSIGICVVLILIGVLATGVKLSSAMISDGGEERCKIYGWVYNDTVGPADGITVYVFKKIGYHASYLVNETKTNEIGYYEVYVDKPGNYTIDIYQTYGENGIKLGRKTVNVSSSDCEKIVNFTGVCKHSVICLRVNNIPRYGRARVVLAVGEKGYVPPWLLAVLYKEYSRFPLIRYMMIGFGRLMERFSYPVKNISISEISYGESEAVLYHLVNESGNYTIVAMTSSKFASKEIYINRWGQELNVILDLGESPLWYKLL